ncbi:TatD family hydrolase [Blattabacterium cuenoti]|uniref:TatD family hydrolase n=1 Tax=Blattabacterium cuenoti TaxID=1653831 RepID=UPI00163CCB4A|nr:TatD family hydrolase [Blattabacterium cuenoti]
MNITDTHAHLYMKDFNNDIDNVINRSIKEGITKILIPSVNNSTVQNIIKLKNKYPNICYPMVGLHPNYVFPNLLNKELIKIEKWLENYSFISIGEIGIDLYSNNKKFLFEQEYAFKRQINFAKEKKLPIVIHCRNAFDYVFKFLKKNNSSIKGVFHCFSGNFNQAKKIIDIGMKLGIGGLITFKNNHIKNFLKKISIENIVLETDSPYLSPHPIRGKRNEPSNIRIILKKISDIYSLSEKKIINIINKNVKNLFFN